jgi:ABC-type antimicrobial peptide transport system permease subunit
MMEKDVTFLGIGTRAIRNISRRKMRALLVIIALGFSMAIMISIPAGISANQAAAQTSSANLSAAIDQTETAINQTAATLNQTLTQIECSLTPTFSGFGLGTGGGGFGGSFGGGFGGGFGGSGSATSGQFPGSASGSGPVIIGGFGGGAFGGPSTPMNESLYSDVSSIANVSAVVPILTASEGQNETFTRNFGGIDRNFTRLVPYYQIEGVPLTSLIDNFPVVPTNITAGSNLQAGESGVVLLSENNSAYFGVGVGGTVSILGASFKVVGIHGTSGVTDRLTLYMNLADAQQITNNTGEITSLQVYADSASDVSAVASAISSLHPEMTVTTAQERLNALTQEQSNYNSLLANANSTVTNAQATLAQTNSTALEEIVVAVVATSLIVLFMMLYTVRERTKEIGTLKAIGFSNGAVLSQFMLEGILLSLFAGIVGIAIGSFAAPQLSGLLLHLNSRATTSVTLSPELMLLGLAGAVTLGALGSLYPAWRASRTRPAEAMRYE